MIKLVCRNPECGADNLLDSKLCEADNLLESISCEVCGGKSFFKIASIIDEVELAEGESFTQYIERMDDKEYYGKDFRRDLAYLYPMKDYNASAWRPDMIAQSDWGGLRKTGIGWKFNPTLFIALIFFLPALIIIPLTYLILYGIDLAVISFIQLLIVEGAYFIILIFITKIIGYSLQRLDDLLKPYGKDSESIKTLFINDLEYFKFGENFFRKTFSMNWLKIGFIVFLAWTTYSVINFIMIIMDPAIYNETNLAPLPVWTAVTLLIFNIGQGLLFFQLFAFLVAIGYGLFMMGNLGADREKLSISIYKNMISQIGEVLTTAQLEKMKISEVLTTAQLEKMKLEKMKIGEVLTTAQLEKMKLEAVQLKKDLKTRGGRTYYEFQRGNRKIGEFLFNIATILILMTVFFGVGLWAVNILNILPESLSGWILIFTIAVSIFGVLSLLIFILPQLKIHLFLKEFKYSLIDAVSLLASRLEFIYFEALIKPSVLGNIDEEWGSRKDLLEEIQIIKNLAEEVKGYGTWSYDFPEVIKLIFVALATMIPIALSFSGMG